MTEEHPPTTPTTVPDAIADEPPATKLVYLLVDANGPTTFGALRDASGLGSSTCRRALDDLLDRDLVEETIPESDQRQDIYRPM